MFLAAVLLSTPLLVLGYLWLCRKWQFWKNQGIKGPTPSLPAGNFGAILSMKVHLLDWLTKLYHQFPEEKIVGIYSVHQPVMVVNDPELARQLLVKDFNHFVDRDPEENVAKLFPGEPDRYCWHS